MSNDLYERTLTSLIDKWSDENLVRAEKFVNAHKGVVPRKLGINQLHAIQGVIVHGSNAIQDYLSNRIQRANKSGPFKKDIEEYFNDLLKLLEQIDVEIGKLTKQIQSTDKEKITNVLKNQIKQRFIQHVISHSNY